MEDFIKNNIGSVIILIAYAAVGLGFIIRQEFKINQIRVDIGLMSVKVKENENTMRDHIGKTEIHIDPHRDEKRFDDFREEIIRQFAETNKKIDRLQLVHSPPQN